MPAVPIALDAHGDPPPERIGPYRIISRLGSGGMASVFRAEQTSLGRIVALKVISPRYATDEEFRRRFANEARLGARISHPNVVATYDAGEDGSQLYLALELVTGGDVGGLLLRRSGRLDEAEALRLVRDCLLGLSAIEAAGLIHRDIKPANVFLDGQGRAKLADLGLARQDGDSGLTTPGMIVGSPAYMAPEQARGDRDLDIRCDIYAIGATLYHMLLGEPPFKSDNPMTALIRVINDPPPDPRERRRDLSEHTARLIGTLLAKDRGHRYPTTASAIEDLDLVIAGKRPRLAGQAPTTGQARNPAPAPGGGTARVDPLAATVKTAAPAAVREPTPPPRTPAKPPSSYRTPLPVAAGPDAIADPSTPLPGAVRIDPVMLAQLAKRVMVSVDGLSAAIVLAPGASFPRMLLDRMISAAGISYGLESTAIHEATRPAQVARRLILARGDPPSPACAGRSVRGEVIDPPAATVTIRVADDGLTAWALCQPGQLATRSDLESELKRSGIRHGIDTAALRRVIEGPPAGDGRTVIARGIAADPGRAPGFALNDGSLHAGGHVAAGEVIAAWDDGTSPRPGLDVLGRSIDLPGHQEQPPDALAGEGTSVGRDRDGRLVLRSTRAGTSLRNPDGRVRVTGIVEISGDLGPGDAPVETSDVVVVRGSVQAGAVIRSTSDVVVCGDLADATVTAGGSLQVGGSIGEGATELVVGDTLEAESMQVRRVLAGSVRIRGTVRACEIVATGDVEVDAVVGGKITAGGTVRVIEAGDSQGTTTELWAGHTLAYGDQSRLAKVQEEKQAAERGRLVEAGTKLRGELDEVSLAHRRLGNARVVDADTKVKTERRLRQLEEQHNAISTQAERSRLALASTRQAQARLRSLGDDGDAAVLVGKVAHQGVIARLADVEPEVLDSPRLKYRLCLKRDG